MYNMKMFKFVFAVACYALAITFIGTSLYADENTPSTVTPSPAAEPALVAFTRAGLHRRPRQ